VFFFISAIAVGIGMVIVEANLSARAFHREVEHTLLRDLGKAAAVVLFLYTALKVYDLISRGAFTYLFVPGLHSALYWVEVSLGVIVPMLILATRRGRDNPKSLLAASGLIVFGVAMNRMNTVLLSWWNYTNGGPIYVPTLAEVTGSIFLVSVGVVAFGLISKFFPIFEDGHTAGAPAE
jgi:Ni/Fe-hydrogenase subunit HybB-like protein